MRTLLSRAAGLSLVFAVGAVSATSSAAAEKTVARFKGETASAEFDRATDTTCEDGSAGVYYEQLQIEAFAGISREDQATTSSERTLNVYYTYLDTCTFAFDSGSVTVTDPAYKQAKVDHARITGTFTIPNSAGDAPLGVVSLDLRLVGTGDALVNQGHERTIDSAGVRHITRWFGESRDASASGVVSVDGESFLPSFVSAQLGDTKSGAVTVTKIP